MARLQLSSALAAPSNIDHELGGRRILQRDVCLPLSPLSDQLCWLFARRTVHRRRNVHHSVDLRRHSTRRTLSVTSAALSSTPCWFRFRVAAAEWSRLTLRRPAQGLVLPLEALDPPQELANLPFAISELPLKLRDLVELLLVLVRVLLAHHTLPAKRVLLIQSAVNRYL